MRKLRPLSPEEQDFAKENHSLVYAFLSEQGLPEDYYDVVVFGYLRAVQGYLSEPKLKRYAFSTIAWKRMKCAAVVYIKCQRAAKRHAEVVSLSEPVSVESEQTWEDVLSKPDSGFAALETREIIDELDATLPQHEMKIIRMRLAGCKMHEIARRSRLTFRDINALLENCRDDVVCVIRGEGRKEKPE